METLSSLSVARGNKVRCVEFPHLAFYEIVMPIIFWLLKTMDGNFLTI